jgi:hypothetical protein
MANTLTCHHTFVADMAIYFNPTYGEMAAMQAANIQPNTLQHIS